MPNETMSADIQRQPDIFAEILPKLRESASAAAPDAPSGRVWAGGCGDGLFAAQAAVPYFQANEVPYRSGSALELGFQHDGPQAGDHAVLMSISGGTRRTVECAQRLQARGVRVIAVTCNPDSALGAAASATVDLDYPLMSRATPHTTDYTVLLLALGTLAEVFGRRVMPDMDSLSERATAVLPDCLETARQIVGARAPHEPGARYIFLGGLDAYGTAAYAAAKFHESGGLPAFAAETENFVHGMNFMLEPSDLVVPIIDPGPTSFRATELAQALPELASTHPIVGSKEAALHESIRPLVDVRNEADLHFPVLSAFAGQALALAVAELTCPDLEQPRAGFSRGERHAAIQTQLMKQGRTITPS